MPWKVPVTSKKQPDPPAYEAPFVSYYTLRAESGEPEPEVVHPVIVPPAEADAAPKEN